MTLFNINKNSVNALLLSLMALTMVPGCSSTEETSDNPEESSYSDCVCADGDVDCKERCVQDLDI